jgi:phosphate transport system permease protein
VTGGEAQSMPGASPTGDARGWVRGRSATWSERIIELGLVGCSTVAILATIGIIAVLVYEGAGFFEQVSLAQFFGDVAWRPDNAQARFGVWPLVIGMLQVAAIAMAVALPFGLMAAIYLSEYAAPRTRRVLKPALELLAGIPSIVYGFFALTVVTPALQAVLPGVGVFNALSAGLVMGVMIIPMIASLSEDAIYAVPDSLREAAYGLGAGKLPTILRVVVPSAWSGIAAAITLAFSRAIGETMIVAIAAGQRTTIGLDPREQTETPAAFIARIAKGDLETGSVTYLSIFAVGLLLFALTLAMNLLGYRLSRNLRARNRS